MFFLGLITRCKDEFFIKKFILVSQNFLDNYQLINFDILTIPYSDHFPILFDFTPI
jgi:hypothetical protein